MTSPQFKHRFSHASKTWIARAAFIGGVSALAFAATSHYRPGVADAQTRSGETRAEEDDYLLTMGWTGAYTAGKQGTVTVKLTPKATYKIDPTFPIKFVLADPPSEHVTYAKKKLEKADGTIGDASAVFNVPFTSVKSGKVTISGKLHFRVCTDKCNTHNVDMAVTIDVAEAPTPAPSPSPSPSPSPAPAPKTP
ncbi:MAG: hypothetical protein U0441_03005 [Polyangiaceae bacterium]